MAGSLTPEVAGSVSLRVTGLEVGSQPIVRDLRGGHKLTFPEAKLT